MIYVYRKPVFVQIAFLHKIYQSKSRNLSHSPSISPPHTVNNSSSPSQYTARAQHHISPEIPQIFPGENINISPALIFLPACPRQRGMCKQLRSFARHSTAQPDILNIMLKYKENPRKLFRLLLLCYWYIATILRVQIVDNLGPRTRYFRMSDTLHIMD